MVFICCVPNCKKSNAEIRVHRFPNKLEVFNQWLNSIHRNDLLHMGLERVHKNYRVCDIHFSDSSRVNPKFYSQSGLIKNALPTLYLPETPVDITAANISGKDVTDEPAPSTSRSCDVYELDEPFIKRIKLDEICSTPHRNKKNKLGRGLTHKINLLRRVNVSRAQQLTPKAQYLYKTASILKNRVAYLEKKNVSNVGRFKEALQFAESGELLEKKLNKTSYRFLISQIEMQSKKSRGRRYSLEDKIFALSILKQSPKGYRLLKKVFALPSRKTLMDLLNKIPFGCGLNQAVLESLRESVLKMKDLDKFCILMFDEMSVETALSYYQKGDYIDGFRNCGDYQATPEFADHVLVFMARGICQKWKQPIAYFTTKSGMNAIDLVRNIKQIISALQEVGLKIVATVSDQYTTNVSAYSKLREETNAWCVRSNIENKYFGYIINGQEMIHLYDCPHLLKGLRNNMLEADVKFKYLGTSERIARWKDVIALYELDVGTDDFKLCPRLTEQHVYLNRLKKMKVKIAAQVFSQRVSAIMRYLSQKGVGLPQSAADTADYLLFGDKLFDSVNGSCIEPVEGKLLRCAIKENSIHHQFWEEALRVLNSIAYFSNTKKDFVPPSIKNWIHTIRGIRCLWQKLQQHGFKFLCPRNLNQDSLENFFSCIRSQAGRNINPTCASFVASYKTLLVNNFTSTHSPGSNCQEDDCNGALNSLKSFLSLEVNDGVQPISEVDDEDVEGEEEFRPEGNTNTLTSQLHSYLAGYLGKKYLKSIRCDKCRNYITSDDAEKTGLIKVRAYTARALLNPNSEFSKVFSKSCEVLHFFLPKLCHKPNVAAKLQHKLFKYVLDAVNWNCENHNLKHHFCTSFVQFYIYAWVKNVNKILRGQDQKNINDSIKKKAQLMHGKIRGKSSKVTKIKDLK